MRQITRPRNRDPERPPLFGYPFDVNASPPSIKGRFAVPTVHAKTAAICHQWIGHGWYRPDANRKRGQETDRFPSPVGTRPKPPKPM
jgi:hypothetical protein